MFPVSAFARSAADSQGNPEGYLADLIGWGPRLLDHVTLEKVEQGGVHRTACCSSAWFSHCSRLHGSSRSCSIPPLRISISTRCSSQVSSLQRTLNQCPMSPFLTSPAKKYITFSEKVLPSSAAVEVLYSTVASPRQCEQLPEEAEWSPKHQAQT